MGWFRLFRRSHWDRERAAELESYLQIETDDNIARGMSQDEARRAAHLKLGNTVRIREEIHYMNTISVLDSLGRDLRHALRGMRRNPTFTLAVVLTLALGLGANTAIFAVVDGVLIKPLAYPDAGELVSLNHRAPGIQVDAFQMSPTQYFTYRDEGRVFQQIGIWGDGGTTITGVGDPEQARMLAVSSGVLEALGIQPALGRIFTEADTTAGASNPVEVGGNAVILTYGYWQRRFGGDPSVLGRQLTADSRPAEIVGVMPESFRFLDIKPQPEVILPIRLNRAGLVIAGFGVRGLARLKPGVTVADANADIARILPIWLNAWPIPPGTVARQAIENWRITPTLQPLKDYVVGGVGDMLWVLMGTLGIVLLIACANVANLMLVRSDGRRHEFAVRMALGAGRTQIARAVLIEGLVLALTGGALGVVLAQAGLKLLVAIAPDTLPRLNDIALDPRVVAFAIVISIVSSLLFCAIPAFKLALRRESPISATARGASASRERQRTRSTLVVVQVALALVLLISSGLMIRTFQALLNVDPGFADAATLQTARVWIPPQQVREDERFTRMQHAILDKIAALPGVRAAAFASAVPMEPNRVALSAIFVDGHTYAPGTTPPGRRMKFVSPGYFGTIGTRLIAGRDITWNDIYRRIRVAVISENFAREVWGSAADALGQRIREPAPGTAPPVWREIIGVVQDVHEDALHQPAPTMVYFPVLMDNFGGQALVGTRAINLVIRSDQAGTESLLNTVRNEVWSVNSNMPVFLVRTMKDLYDDSMARTSFAMVMLAIAGAMALGLGLIGIYGVMSYVVSRRAREIGLRLALGAEPAALKRMFVKHGLALTGIGIAIGLVAALGLTRLMSSLLFGTGPLDPATYIAVLFVLTVAAVLASYVPARRAAMVNPMTTLSED
jgi:putative ABC transport system permease protein